MEGIDFPKLSSDFHMHAMMLVTTPTTQISENETIPVRIKTAYSKCLWHLQ